MKIDINKKYKTRNDLEYFCYWVGDGKAHGAYITKDGVRKVIVHTDEGHYYPNRQMSELDLIEVKEKKQLTGFLNVYEDGIRGNNLWPSKEDADMTALSHHTNRIACIDLSQYGIFYEENEGL